MDLYDDDELQPWAASLIQHNMLVRFSSCNVIYLKLNFTS